MKLRYTPEAIRDLTGIKHYIADNLSNPNAAKTIVQKIMRGCSQLKRFPMSGFSLEAKTGQDTDLRVLVCENYLALYRLEDGFVSVARVVNGRQDYITELFGDDITMEASWDEQLDKM